MVQYVSPSFSLSPPTIKARRLPSPGRSSSVAGPLLLQRSSVALELFIKYGAPAKSQNLNIYRHLATEILLEDKNDIKSLIGLRNIFHSLVKEVTSPTINMEFECYLRLFHYTVISN
ncbi:hypothetical protein DAPPUDRAFT_277407, partial [Daphnia pulex]